MGFKRRQIWKQTWSFRRRLYVCERKELGHHYQVVLIRHNIFFTFLKKKLVHLEERVYILRIQRPLPCRGSRSKKPYSFCSFFFLPFWKNKISPLLWRGSIQKIWWPLGSRCDIRNQWPLPRKGSWCKEIDDYCLVEGLDVT